MLFRSLTRKGRRNGTIPGFAPWMAAASPFLYQYLAKKGPVHDFNRYGLPGLVTPKSQRNQLVNKPRYAQNALLKTMGTGQRLSQRQLERGNLDNVPTVTRSIRLIRRKD